MLKHKFSKTLFRLCAVLCCMTVAVQANAQSVEMADSLRADGKIYVVVAVLGVILLGLFAYLISLDRKINKLEKRQNQSSD